MFKKKKSENGVKNFHEKILQLMHGLFITCVFHELFEDLIEYMDFMIAFVPDIF